MSTPRGEQLFVLYDFERFADDSSIRLKMDVRSSFFDIHNFSLYSDFHAFKTFLPGLLNIYRNLEGTASLFDNEDSKLNITGKKSGHILISCKAYYHNAPSSSADICIELDQTFRPGFIDALKKIYKELDL